MPPPKDARMRARIQAEFSWQQDAEPGWHTYFLVTNAITGKANDAAVISNVQKTSRLEKRNLAWNVRVRSAEVRDRIFIKAGL